MKARIPICIAAVCVLMLITGCFRTIFPPLPPSVNYYVTPDEIVSEFRDDKFAATAKYDGKTISVSGYVSNKDIGDSGNPFVGLKEEPHSDVMKGVVCVFPRSALSELTPIEDGEYLTIIGEFDQYGVQSVWILPMYIVQLKNCRFP